MIDNISKYCVLWCSTAAAAAAAHNKKKTHFPFNAKAYCRKNISHNTCVHTLNTYYFNKVLYVERICYREYATRNKIYKKKINIQQAEHQTYSPLNSHHCDQQQQQNQCTPHISSQRRYYDSHTCLRILYQFFSICSTQC